MRSICGQRAQRFAGLVLLTAAASLAADDKPPSVSEAANDKPVVMPKMTVRDFLQEYPLIPKEQLKPATFTDVPPATIFPARAKHEGILDGRATIGVMLDPSGKPIDYLLIRYSQKYFGDELIAAVQHEKFTPRRIKGVPVAAPFYVKHKFDIADDTAPTPSGLNFDPMFSGDVRLTPMEEMTQSVNRITHHDGPPYIYEPHLEFELEHGVLDPVACPVPALPAGYPVDAGKPVKVLVYFYVDETGRVRLPSVESIPSADLVPEVVSVVSQWKFAPPKAKGKPVLVFAMRGLRLTN